MVKCLFKISVVSGYSDYPIYLGGCRQEYLSVLTNEAL